MNYQEWKQRRARGEKVELPSGLVVTLKKVSVFDLAERGEIPTTLQSQVEGLMAKATTGISIKDFLAFGPVMNLTVQACIVSPQELRAEELPYTDRLAVFQWANALADGLQFFREEEGESVGAG